MHDDGSLVSAFDQFINHNLHQPLILWVLLIAFLSEWNYLLFFRKKVVWFALGSICVGLSGSAISLVFTTGIDIYPREAQFLTSFIGITIYIVGYAVLYDFLYQRYYNARFKQKQSESELYLLKAQINPHFFFNTLNNIYGMALNEGAHKTASGIDLLSGIMRYNMDGIRDTYTNIETEFRFIENYIKLQGLRIPEKENIDIAINISYPDRQYQIAPMLLMPLIENSWKYGISMDAPCYIKLNINVTDGCLIMNIANSILLNRSDNRGSGLGLSNVKQRLKLLYPNRYEYLAEIDENNYRITLSIVLK
ncbi:MAG: histidine kinase [Mucilaginibacter sp.]|uniref:sensor histidine kinase n=1 Tax=Mucilaginibacter sp. TaxID=1882438 RepID=UPI0031B1F76E